MKSERVRGKETKEGEWCKMLEMLIALIATVYQ